MEPGVGPVISNARSIQAAKKTSMTTMVHCAWPRAYPPAFGRRLFEIWRDAPEEVSSTLRTKSDLAIPAVCVGIIDSARRKIKANDSKQSDREVFQAMSLGDPWHDAELISVWCYLYEDEKTCVPDSWVETMADFHKELMTQVPPADLIEQYNCLLSS